MKALENAAERLRVGIIANSLVSEQAALNGGFIHVLEVAKRWETIDVVFFAPESTRSILKRELPNAEFVPASPTVAPRWLSGNALTFSRLLLSFARGNELRSCDVVLTTTPFLADVLPTAVVRRGRVAIIVQHLQTVPWKRPGNLLTNLLAYVTEQLGLALGRSQASLWFLNDPDVAKRLSLDLSRTTIAQMSHGVDHLRFEPHGPSAERAGALYVGRLHPTKGLGDLLRAWRIVAAQLPDAQLRLIGSGDRSYRASLERTVASLGLTANVRFLGRLDENAKCSELSRARVFAFPSLEEGWGIALAEAMTFALPCVTYDLLAYRNVFTAGRLEVPKGDVSAFAASLLRLLQDEAEWQRLSREAALLAETFTWERAADIEHNALCSLVSVDAARRSV